MFNHFFQLRRLILLLVLLAGWEFASRFILDKTQATLLPPPSGVINGFIELGASGELWKHIRDSLKREFVLPFVMPVWQFRLANNYGLL